MAKKTGGPNKSQAIREYYTANPDAKPKAVVEALAAQGIEVSPAFVSTIKSTTFGKSIKGGRRVSKRVPKSVSASAVGAAAPAAAKTSRSASTSGEITIDSLVKAKGLVRDLGGIDNAINALTALKRLAD